MNRARRRMGNRSIAGSTAWNFFMMGNGGGAWRFIGMRSGRGILYRRSISGSSGGEEKHRSKVLHWDPSDILIGCHQATRLSPQGGTRLAPASFFCFCGLEIAKIETNRSKERPLQVQKRRSKRNYF